MRHVWDFIRNQPVRFFALVCVAITSAYVMWMGYLQNEQLKSSQWCDRILKADQLDANTRLDAALACVGMQKLQITAIANGSYINGGTIALCLLALMVIVVAGGHLSFSSPLGSANVGASEAAGAQKVAEAAVVKAQEIKGEAP